jgi:hypothetical protein
MEWFRSSSAGPLSDIEGDRSALGRDRILEETVQKQLDTKIVHPGSEEDRREFPLQDQWVIELGARHLHHFDLFPD